MFTTFEFGMSQPSHYLKMITKGSIHIPLAIYTIVFKRRIGVESEFMFVVFIDDASLLAAGCMVVERKFSV